MNVRGVDEPEVVVSSTSHWIQERTNRLQVKAVFLLQATGTCTRLMISSAGDGSCIFAGG